MNAPEEPRGLALRALVARGYDRMGTYADPGTVDSFFGELMYWSGYEAQAHQQAVIEAGLVLWQAREWHLDEFGTSATFLWVVAQRP